MNESERAADELAQNLRNEREVEAVVNIDDGDLLLTYGNTVFQVHVEYL